MSDPQNPRIVLAPSLPEYLLLAGGLLILSVVIALISNDLPGTLRFMLPLSIFCFFIATFFDFKTVLEDENGLTFRYGYGLFKRIVPYDSIEEVRFVMIPKSGWGIVISQKSKKKRAFPLKQKKKEIRKFAEYLHRKGIPVYWFI